MHFHWPLFFIRINFSKCILGCEGGHELFLGCGRDGQGGVMKYFGPILSGYEVFCFLILSISAILEKLILIKKRGQ